MDPNSFVPQSDITSLTLAEIKLELENSNIIVKEKKCRGRNSLSAEAMRFSESGAPTVFIFSAKEEKKGVSAYCCRKDGAGHGCSKGDSALSAFINEASKKAAKIDVKNSSLRLDFYQSKIMSGGVTTYIHV